MKESVHFEMKERIQDMRRYQTKESQKVHFFINESERKTMKEIRSMIKGFGENSFIREVSLFLVGN